MDVRRSACFAGHFCSKAMKSYIRRFIFHRKMMWVSTRTFFQNNYGVIWSYFHDWKKTRTFKLAAFGIGIAVVQYLLSLTESRKHAFYIPYIRGFSRGKSLDRFLPACTDFVQVRRHEDKRKTSLRQVSEWVRDNVIRFAGTLLAYPWEPLHAGNRGKRQKIVLPLITAPDGARVRAPL